ncbi:MAG: 3-hydroxyacyl-CoA dehydrogenase family protein [Planctomycetota bacterium]|jgi:3-hydroxyacyl-CoA dehydrogenase
MIDRISTVLVLGASGTVGSLVGGLIAQKQIKVFFISRTLERVQKGLDRACSQARSDVIRRHITCGTYDDLFENAAGQADWIVECVAEDLAVKKHIYQQIENCRRPDSIISTTTSSLPLQMLVEGRSESFRKNFMATHFYNPPQKMTACELAGTSDTDPDVLEFMEKFLTDQLARVVTLVWPSAGFVGNRIVFSLFNRITMMAMEYGAEVMDYLIGPYTGRLMAPLRTIDLVGLDIHAAIVKNLHHYNGQTTDGELEVPNYVVAMIEKKLLGDKTPDAGGFYKKFENGLLFIEPQTGMYVPAVHPHLLFVEEAKNLVRLGLYKQAFESLQRTTAREVDLVKEIFAKYIEYSYGLVGKVTEENIGIEGIDRVMTYGFNWAAPSTLVSILGGRQRAVNLLKENGCNVPASLLDGPYREKTTIDAGRFFLAR